MDRLRAVYNAWLERTNPLAGLSVSRARSLYDAARAYGSPRLQYTYDEIELTDPVLLTCTERRASAIAGMGWKFRARAAADATLAQEQRDALQTFANDIANLTEALEHLDLAFFRGFAHVQPIWDGEKVQHIALLKSWNFLRTQDGTWWWNPECRETPFGLEPIGPEARLVTVTRRRAIDYPALSIHIRHALGERDWGRFVERYGIPPADITMAPNATEADRPKYENTADAAKDGRNIVLPNGASVTRAGDTRGVNPFLDFCEYQAKQILILATGGTLATLAEGDTGTLAGNAQENVWRQIVARDGGVISDALNRALFRPFLAMKFPNRPTCVDFELGADKTPSAEEVFDLAAKAKSAGYLIAQDELEEASGYTLEKDAQQPQNAPMLGLARARDAAPPLQTAKSALQNAPKKPDAQGEGESAPALLGPFLRALKEDCKPLAAEVEELLKDPTPEKARALLDKIPALVPSDPTLAPILAEEMVKAYGDAFISAKEERAVAAAKQDANGNEHAEAGSGNGGQFVSKGDGASSSPSGTTEEVTHTPEQQKRIEEYQAAVDQEALAWREAVMQMDEKAQKEEFFKFGESDSRMAGDIKNITGIDTEGWPIKMQGNHAVHIDIRHGAQGKADHSMADPKDFARIGYAVKNYDEISALPDNKGYRSGDNQPAKQVEFRTRIDGTMVVQTVVPDTKAKTLLITSTRIKKAKG